MASERRTQGLAYANENGRVLITDDQDFGELVFRYGYAHAGVIYFRLSTDAFELRTSRLDKTLEQYPAGIDQFLVVTDDRIRPAGGRP